MDIFSVLLSKSAKKSLERVPDYIALKLWSWVEAVSHKGLTEVRKLPGYHDEPLKGLGRVSGLFA